jgi:hypothetical protein
MISKDGDIGLNAGLDLRMLTPHSVLWISVYEDRAEHRRNQELEYVVEELEGKKLYVNKHQAPHGRKEWLVKFDLATEGIKLRHRSCCISRAPGVGDRFTMREALYCME